jgi:hypothetical protein
LGALHVLDDFRDDLLLIAGELEWQHAARGFPDVVGDDHRSRLALGIRSPAPQHQPELKQKELFEDQAPLRRRPEAVQRLDGSAGWRKVNVEERRAPVDELLTRTHLRRQRIDDGRWQLRQRLMDDDSLHLRGQRAGLLVDRHDAAGVQRLVIRVNPRRRPPISDLGGGFCICMPCGVSSSRPSDDPLVR